MQALFSVGIPWGHITADGDIETLGTLSLELHVDIWSHIKAGKSSIKGSLEIINITWVFIPSKHFSKLLYCLKS